MESQLFIEGYNAASKGVVWWNNPFKSGSIDAYQWDSGHTRYRTTHETITGTIAENFRMALEQEDIMKEIGVKAPYFTIAKANVAYYLDCAAALERGERDIIRKSVYHLGA